MVKDIGSTIAMSQDNAEQYSCKPHSEAVVIISITSPLAWPPSFDGRPDNGIKAILRLRFDDMDTGATAMSQEDAKAAAQFVLNWVNDEREIDRIIVHCQAGQSRSVV